MGKLKETLLKELMQKAHAETDTYKRASLIKEATEMFINESSQIEADILAEITKDLLELIEDLNDDITNLYDAEGELYEMEAELYEMEAELLDEVYESNEGLSNDTRLQDTYDTFDE